MGYSVSKSLRAKRNLSERQFAAQAGISRSILRKLESGSSDIRLESLKILCSQLDRNLDIMLSPIALPDPSKSVLFLSILIERDGFKSWKIHLMDFVDNFRHVYDPRLLVLPPIETLDKKLIALIASVVLYLCDEIDAQPPAWARSNHCIQAPWFVSNMESLKASALKESTWHFKINNIFVLENFLSRA